MNLIRKMAQDRFLVIERKAASEDDCILRFHHKFDRHTQAHSVFILLHTQTLRRKVALALETTAMCVSVSVFRFHFAPMRLSNSEVYFFLLQRIHVRD